MVPENQAEKRRRASPSWQDLVSEGVIDHVPEPGPDGKIDVPVQGHGKVKRALQMMRDRYEADVDYFDERHARVARKHFRDREGRDRWAREDRMDKVVRKFGLSRRSFTVVLPEGYAPMAKPLGPGRHRFVPNEDGEFVEDDP